MGNVRENNLKRDLAAQLLEVKSKTYWNKKKLQSPLWTALDLWIARVAMGTEPGTVGFWARMMTAPLHAQKKKELCMYGL